MEKVIYLKMSMDIFCEIKNSEAAQVPSNTLDTCI